MEDIQWANLIELDLSNFSDPTGKAHLVTQLATALRTTGCFMIKNFDIDDDTISRQFELGSQFFDLPLEEKVPFYDEAGWAQNDQRGYKPAARGLML
jgi:isopenicillin N synthase-like dioxygenase